MSDHDQLRRASLAFDWFVRVYAPAFLRIAGLDDRAAKLVDLPTLTLGSPKDHEWLVHLRLLEIEEDIKARRHAVGKPGPDGLAQNDRVYRTVLETFREAGGLGPLLVTQRVWSIADAGAVIAIAAVDGGAQKAVIDQIRETQERLERELSIHLAVHPQIAPVALAWAMDSEG